MEKVAVGLVSEGLRRWRLKYDDDERGRVVVVDWEGGAFDFCLLPAEPRAAAEGVVFPDAMGDRWEGGV